MINLGVIGTGVMGSNHIRVISSMEEAKLTAISDVDENKLKKISVQYNVKTYKDHKEMLAKEKLDGVIVAVPSAYHKKVVLDCINAGVNVLVEKPIAHSIEEAKEMIKAAKEKGIIFTVGHTERFNPVVSMMKKFIDENVIGDIYLVNTIRIGPFPKRLYGLQDGVLIDLSVHDVDVIRYLVGDVKQVYSQLIMSGKQEIYAKALFLIDNKVHGSSEFSWVSPKKTRIIEIYGTKGMLRGDYMEQTLRLYENSDVSETALTKGSIAEGKMVKYPLYKQEPLKLELLNFIDSINSKKKPLVAPEDALEALKVALAILEAGSTNKVVNL